MYVESHPETKSDLTQLEMALEEAKVEVKELKEDLDAAKKTALDDKDLIEEQDRTIRKLDEDRKTANVTTLLNNELIEKQKTAIEKVQEDRETLQVVIN
jgi:hypothetical protein